MKLIRGRKNDIVSLGREPSHTRFPTCARCLQPVHAYAVVDIRRGILCREVDVEVECHGAKETKILTVPLGKDPLDWVRDESGTMMFFVPSSLAPS